MAKPFESDQVALVRRSRWSRWLPALPMVAPFLALGSRSLHLHPAFDFLLVVIAMVAVLRRRALPPKLEPTKISADRTGVTFAKGRTKILRADIVKGLVTTESGGSASGYGARVILHRRGLAPPIELAVADPHEGRELLRALGLDASQVVATFLGSALPLANRASRTLFVLSLVALGVAMSLVAGSHPAYSAALYLLPMSVLALVFFPTKMSVGADGVLYSWLGRKRFLPFADVNTVTTYREGRRGRIRGVVLALKSGGEVRLPVAQRGLVDDAPELVLAERIREAMDTHSMGDAEPDASVLRRGSQSVARWITALKSIGAGASASMRTAPVAPEKLWRIAEDPRAEPAMRAAAAVALGTSIDDDGRARLRAAAQAIASPKLRVALETASAESSEETLATALAELEQEEEDASPKDASRGEAPT